MSRRKGMSKKELRAPDEFQNFILELTERYGNYWKLALILIAFIIIIPLCFSGYKYFNNKNENKAAVTLSMLTNSIKTLDTKKKIEELDKYLNNYGNTNAAIQALMLKGKILFENNKFGRAAQVFQNIIDKSSIEEFSGQAKLALALCKLKTGDKNSAVNILSELTNNNITGADANFYLALIYEQSNNTLKAKSYYQRIIDKYKNYPYFKMAELKLEHLK